MNKTSTLSKVDKSIIALWKSSDSEKEMLISICLVVREYELEDAVQDYLDSNPDASFIEAVKYITSLCPPVEIVDDDELDDEE